MGVIYCDEAEIELAAIAPNEQAAIRAKVESPALAQKIGSRQPALSRLEIGDYMPTIGTLLKIAKSLDIEIPLDIRPTARPRVSLVSDEARVVERLVTWKGRQELVAAS